MCYKAKKVQMFWLRWFCAPWFADIAHSAGFKVQTNIFWVLDCCSALFSETVVKVTAYCAKRMCALVWAATEMVIFDLSCPMTECFGCKFYTILIHPFSKSFDCDDNCFLAPLGLLPFLHLKTHYRTTIRSMEANKHHI